VKPGFRIQQLQRVNHYLFVLYLFYLFLKY